MKSKKEIKRFQEFLMNSWPAKDYYFLNGWILRFTKGVTSRANSVFPIKYTGTQKTLNTDISLVEKAYKAHRMSSMISPQPFTLLCKWRIGLKRRDEKLEPYLCEKALRKINPKSDNVLKIRTFHFKAPFS